MSPLSKYINKRIQKYNIVFKTDIDIMRYCSDIMRSRFPLVSRGYYEEFDLEFQFTPTTHKKWAGYYDNWEELKEWHVITSIDIEKKFREHYPEKVI